MGRYTNPVSSLVKICTLCLFREEAACTVVRDTMFILGGIVDGDMTSSVELWNSEKEEWQASTDMPEVRKL